MPVDPEVQEALAATFARIDELRQALFRSGPFSAGHPFEHGIDAHVPRNKSDATTAPGVGDDSADAYGVGSIWIDITNDKAYICLDATVGAAVWTEITNLAAADTFDLIIMEDGVEVGISTLGQFYVKESGVEVGSTATVPGTVTVEEADVAVGTVAAPVNVVVKEGGVQVGTVP